MITDVLVEVMMELGRWLTGIHRCHVEPDQKRLLDRAKLNRVYWTTRRHAWLDLVLRTLSRPLFNSASGTSRFSAGTSFGRGTIFDVDSISDWKYKRDALLSNDHFEDDSEYGACGGAAAAPSKKKQEPEGIPCDFCGVQFSDVNELCFHEQSCLEEQKKQAHALQEELNKEDEKRTKEVEAKTKMLQKEEAERRRMMKEAAERRQQSNALTRAHGLVSAGPKLTDQACPAFKMNTAECSECKKQILLCDLQDHEDKCSDEILRNIFMTCNDCGNEIKWENITKHELKCPKRKDSDHGQWQEASSSSESEKAPSRKSSSFSSASGKEVPVEPPEVEIEIPSRKSSSSSSSESEKVPSRKSSSSSYASEKEVP
ncbi:unnamed protein product, partial [Cyprideis torosa]